MAYLSEDHITAAAATLPFLLCWSLICYLIVCLLQASIPHVSFLQQYQGDVGLFTVLLWQFSGAEHSEDHKILEKMLQTLSDSRFKSLFVTWSGVYVYNYSELRLYWGIPRLHVFNCFHFFFILETFVLKLL